jgi:hypothetical protein
MLLCGGKEPGMAIQPDNVGLMQAVNFTQEDLEANRQGRLSPPQIQAEQARHDLLATNAQKAATRGPWVMIYGVVLVVILGVLFFVTGLYQTVQTSLGSLTWPVLGGVALVVLLVLLIMPISYQRQVRRYQAQAAVPFALPVVQTVAGALNTKIQRGNAEYNTPDIYYIIVEGVRISTGKKTMQAFKKGQAYRLYYVGEGKALRLISAESLGP